MYKGENMKKTKKSTHSEVCVCTALHARAQVEISMCAYAQVLVRLHTSLCVRFLVFFMFSPLYMFSSTFSHLFLPSRPEITRKLYHGIEWHKGRIKLLY